MPRPNAAITDLAALLPSGATVIAVTDDGTEPQYASVRQFAAGVAQRVDGNVLFCVAPARDPSPARDRPRLFFPGEDAPGRVHTGTRARDLLLAEAEEVAAPGLAVGVWLPSRHGPAGIAEAVAASGAVLVVVRARACRVGLLDRTLEYLAARVPAPIVAVRPDGSSVAIRALGEPPKPGWPRIVPAGGAAVPPAA